MLFKQQRVSVSLNSNIYLWNKNKKLLQSYDYENIISIVDIVTVKQIKQDTISISGKIIINNCYK